MHTVRTYHPQLTHQWRSTSVCVYIACKPSSYTHGTTLRYVLITAKNTVRYEWCCKPSLYTWFWIPSYIWFCKPSLVIHGFVYCIHGFVCHHPLYMVMYTNVCMVSYAITRCTWFCIPSLVIHGYVYQCIHGYVCHHSLYMVMYTNVCMHGFVCHHSLYMILYTITRYTWLCIPMYPWFCMPSLLIHDYVYQCMHGFVCHHSLYMVMYIYMVLHAVTRYTWLCIPPYVRRTWFCMPSLVVHGFVYHHFIHGFVYYRLL